MFDAPAARLAVAMLKEVQGAETFRHDPARAVQGYGLVTGDAQSCRISTYLENGRSLDERRPDGFFYYEAWLLGGGSQTSLGAFNASSAGEANASCIRDVITHRLDQAVGLRITAEPFGGSKEGARPVLEGSLVWLQGLPPAPHQTPTPLSANDVQTEALAALRSVGPHEAFAPSIRLDAEAIDQGQPPLPWQGMLCGDQRTEESVTHDQSPSGSDDEGQSDESAETDEMTPSSDATGSGEPTAESADDESQPDNGSDGNTHYADSAAEFQAVDPTDTFTAGESQPREAASVAAPSAAAAASVPTDVTAPQAGPDAAAPPRAEEPTVTGFHLRPEQAVPISVAPHAPVPVKVPTSAPAKAPFTSLHPLAPRAGGSALIDRGTGTLTLTLWGLPGPASLGRDRQTNRPYNCYQVWLRHHGSLQQILLGWCTRMWGENFRFETDDSHPLSQYDSILITTGDRSASTPNPTAPQVLQARYTLT